MTKMGWEWSGGVNVTFLGPFIQNWDLITEILCERRVEAACGQFTEPPTGAGPKQMSSPSFRRVWLPSMTRLCGPIQRFSK